MPVSGTYQHKRYTAAVWTANNYMLLPGELAFETDTSLAKINLNSVATAWNSLPYNLAAATSPDAFSFTNASGVTPNTVVTSNAVTLAGSSGVADVWPVTVDPASSVAEVRVNGGTWSNSRSPAVVARSGDSLEVRATSGSSGVARPITIRVSDRTTTWTVTSVVDALAGLGVLAEYDFLKGPSESATVLYDRKTSGTAANGIVGPAATYSSLGLTTALGDTTGFAKSGVPSNSVKTIVLYISPISGGDAIASNGTNGVLTAFYSDFAGDLPKGQLVPRMRDLNTSAQISADINAASWPFSLAFVFDTPGRMYVNGTAPTTYAFQSNASSFVFNSDVVTFGNNFVSNGTSQHRYHYAILFDRVLTVGEVAQVHSYIQSKCSGRSIPASGPAALTTNFAAFIGNSLTNMLVLSNITPTGTWDKLLSGISGGTPSQVVAKAAQAIYPLRRPLASRNVAVLWLSPNDTAANSYAAYQSICPQLRALGFRVVVIYPASAYSGGVSYDAEKNALKSLLDGNTYGVGTGLADARVILPAEVAADGAYSNTTYFLDQLHHTDAARTLYYPLITAAINAAAA